MLAHTTQGQVPRTGLLSVACDNVCTRHRERKGLGGGVLPGSDAVNCLGLPSCAGVTGNAQTTKLILCPGGWKLNVRVSTGLVYPYAPGLLMATGSCVPYSFLFDLIGLFKEDTKHPEDLTLTCSPL